MKINEKDIFLLLTDKCNLNCFSCGYKCENVKDPWYINDEDFENILLKLKNTNIDNCSNYSINLTGGDPLLHPNWLKYALLTRKILPECVCYISTNGLLLHSIPDEVLQFCINNNIRFGITIYPSMKLLPMYLQIKERFEKLKISNFLSWNPTKITFGKHTFLNLNEQKLYSNNKMFDICYEHMFKECDFCFIYKNKLYNCQNAFYQDRMNGISDIAFGINDINENNLSLKNPITKHECKNCKIGSTETILWHLNSKVPAHCLKKSLKELYLEDYENYYLLVHDCKEHLECLKHEFFIQNFQNQFSKFEKIRFFKGKADIFIPFNQFIDNNFYNLLKSQMNLDKYNLYFISYTNNQNINESVYDLFYIPNENIFFLKANNYLEAIHIFLQNSYLDNKYCLDINNYQDLNNINFLDNRK